MLIGKPRRLLLLLDRPWLWAGLLLSLPWSFSQTEWMLTLRGYGLIESEMELAQTHGYYEDLIRTSAPGRAQPRVVVNRPPGWVPFADSGIVQVVDDYQRWRLRPSLDFRWNGEVFRTNRLGYRGPEIATPKPESTFRIIVIGSSNTIGHGVGDDEVYTRGLERWLEQRTPSDRHVEVVNLAVSGDSPTQRLLRLQNEACRLDPDWILGDVTALDFSLEENHLHWVVEQGVEPPFDFVREALRNSVVSIRDTPALFHKKLSPFSKPLLDLAYAGWAAESHRLGVAMTVVILPRADSKTESPRLFRLLNELALDHGLKCIDLSALFDDLKLADYQVAPWDNHPNALGHRLIFKELGASLMADEDFAAEVSNPKNVGIDNPDDADVKDDDPRVPLSDKAV
ncbi:MAG: SGNH/GDSL hydrolase family protein [Isosphaeraceae bacterium]